MSLDGWIGVGISDEVIEQAHSWIARLDSNLITDGERLQFWHWLDESPEHRWAYEELSESWAKLSMLKDAEHQVDRSRVVAFPAKTQTAFVTANVVDRYSGQSVAALLLMVCGLLLSVFTLDTKSHAVARGGEIMEYQLTDGSTLVLNAGAAVSYDYSTTDREVWLTEGEMIATVKQDSRPFVVHTPFAEIIALGTKFAVSVDPFDHYVLVIEGEVSVNSPAVSGDVLAFYGDSVNGLIRESYQLAAGEKLTWYAPRERFHKQLASDIDAELSWQQGLLTFTDVTLAEAAHQFMQHNDVHIYLANDTLKNSTINGTFAANDYKSFLNSLYSQQGLSIYYYSSKWVVINDR